MNKNAKKVAIIISIFIILCLSAIYGVISLNDLNYKRMVGSGGGVCDMFISKEQLIYVDFNQTLYQYDNATGQGKKLSKINIASGASIYKNGDYIYYSDGKSISRSTTEGKSQVKLLSGENIYVNAVEGDKLFYDIAFKDSDNKGYSNFEYHIYDLKNKKDTVLFSKSEDMWFIRAASGDKVFADLGSKTASGIYSINLPENTRKKLSDQRPFLGCIVGENFYFSTGEKRDMWSVNIKDNKMDEIPVPSGVQHFTGFGDYLYIAVNSNSGNNIISYNIKNRKVETLAKISGVVWKLCSDGKTLYSYDMKFPADKQGSITAIPLK